MKITDYFKPKSLIYTGDYKHEQTLINRFVYDQVQVDEFHDIKQSEQKQYIQVIGLSDLAQIKEIKNTFKIDDFIVEDILNVNQRNKIEKVGDYIFAAFSLMYKDKGIIKKDYMSLIFNEQVLITFHENEPVFLSPLKTLLYEYEELRTNKLDFLFYQILDLLTDDHLNIYDFFEDEMNRFEDEILETKQIDQDDFYKLRKQILQLKNITYPIYDHLEILLKIEISFINKSTKKFFDDLLDHMYRLDQRINQLRDLMKTLLDLDINNQSNRMNRIMSTLTLFSAIFIPLSFLTGFFGMNFIYFDILSYEYAVIIFAGVCLLIAGIMIYIFKKHRWF